MRGIATKLVKGEECDTLLDLCDLEVSNLESQVEAQDSMVTNLKSIVLKKDQIIDGKELEIVGLRDVLKVRDNKLKWTKFKWAGTTVVLGAGLLYFIVN